MPRRFGMQRCSSVSESPKPRASSPMATTCSPTANFDPAKTSDHLDSTKIELSVTQQSSSQRHSLPLDTRIWTVDKDSKARVNSRPGILRRDRYSLQSNSGLLTVDESSVLKAEQPGAEGTSGRRIPSFSPTIVSPDHLHRTRGSNASWGSGSNFSSPLVSLLGEEKFRRYSGYHAQVKSLTKAEICFYGLLLVVTFVYIVGIATAVILLFFHRWIFE